MSGCMKSHIEFSDFQRLDLRIGTVIAVRRLGPLKLVAAIIDAGDRVAPLLLASATAQLAAMSRVVVALGLHPLVAHGSTHTACLIAVLSDDVEAADGSRAS